MKWILRIILCFVAFNVYAETFEEGKDYTVLPASMTTPSKKPTVTEFFNYGCPACFYLEDKLEKWLSQQDQKIGFNRVPVVFHPGWDLYAKAYYAADALEILPKATPILFRRIHKEHKPLNTPARMLSVFINDLGAPPQAAESLLLQSTSVDMQVKEGMQRAGQYTITQIPAFVVCQRYKTDLGLAKDPKRLMHILNFLIKKHP